MKGCLSNSRYFGLLVTSFVKLVKTKNRILKLTQGNHSKGLFTWNREDPSTWKILEGGSLKFHVSFPHPTPPTGGKARESLLGGGAKRRMRFQTKRADHPSAVHFLYSVYMQRVAHVPSARIFLFLFLMSAIFNSFSTW